MPPYASNTFERFEMFGIQHFGALGAITVAAFVTCRVIRASRGGRLPWSWWVHVCRANAVALLIYALLGEIYWIQVGWTVQTSLPLHLCDLALFVTAAALWVHSRPTEGKMSNVGSSVAPGLSLPLVTVLRSDDSPQLSNPMNEPDRAAVRPDGLITVDGHEAPARLATRRGMLNRQALFEVAYYWGLGGTVQALLTPELVDPFPSLSYLKFFAGHGLIIVGVFALACGLRLRPRPWSPVRIWLATNVLVPPMLLFNWLTGSNYMYLCGPPATASIMDYFGPWPLSLLTLEAVALLIMTILYLPCMFMHYCEIGRVITSESKSRS